MTEQRDARGDDPGGPVPAASAVVPRNGIAGTAGRFFVRSNANRRSTMAHIAHRRLWRPAAYPRLDWKSWICIFAAVLALMLAVFDEPVGSFGRRWPDDLVVLAEATTRTGLSGWYLIPAALVGVVVNLTDWSRLRGRRLLSLYNWTMLSVFVLLSVGIPGIVVTFLKHFIGRARPFYFAEMGAYSFQPLTGSSGFASFPSGHSCTIGSVAAIIVLLFPATRFVVVPLALALASTRIVLSSHYPSDVVAGLALGSSCTILVALVFARLGYLFMPTQQGLPRRRKSFRVFR